MNELDNGSDAKAISALRELPREKRAPDSLEQTIVGALKDAGLIQRRAFRWRQFALLFAAAVVIAGGAFKLGTIAIAQQSSRGSMASQNSPEFLFLLRNSPREAPINSEEQERQRVREYSAWAHKLNQQGIVLEGDELKDEARILDLIDGRAVVSGQDQTEAAVAGFFRIRAHDYQQAVAIAEDCPHAKYGGTIEIRQIEQARK
jgi:hypothetical protein